MSIENVKRFVEVAKQDKSLQQRFSGVRDAQEFARIAAQVSAERGFAFTAEEFLASIGRRAKGAVELDDNQLESVAGGFFSLGWSPSDLAEFDLERAWAEEAQILESLPPSQQPSKPPQKRKR